MIFDTSFLRIIYFECAVKFLRILVHSVPFMWFTHVLLIVTSSICVYTISMLLSKSVLDKNVRVYSLFNGSTVFTIIFPYVIINTSRLFPIKSSCWISIAFIPLIIKHSDRCQIFDCRCRIFTQLIPRRVWNGRASSPKPESEARRASGLYLFISNECVI